MLDGQITLLASPTPTTARRVRQPDAHPLPADRPTSRIAVAPAPGQAGASPPPRRRTWNSALPFAWSTSRACVWIPTSARLQVVETAAMRRPEESSSRRDRLEPNRGPLPIDGGLQKSRVQELIPNRRATGLTRVNRSSIMRAVADPRPGPARQEHAVSTETTPQESATLPDFLQPVFQCIDKKASGPWTPSSASQQCPRRIGRT
jgi:hypothetical protein